MTDNVNHPPHYTADGIECIDICEHLPFCWGNAVKYIWRMGRKGSAREDAEKAKWYIRRAISNRLPSVVPAERTFYLREAMKVLPESLRFEAINNLLLVASGHAHSALLLSSIDNLADELEVQND